MATIGLLAYKITADTTGFSAGVTATRAELKAARAITEQTMTANERLEQSLQGLEQLYNVGAISAETYARATDHVQREAQQAAAATAEYGMATASATASQDAMIASQLAGVPVVGQLAGGMMALNPATIAVTAAIAGVAVGIGAAVTAGSALVDTVTRSTEAILDLDRSSQQLGIGAGSLAGLRDAASDFAGVSGDQLDGALAKMSERLADAAVTGKGATEALTTLGLSATQLVGAGTEQAFFQIADAIREIPNPMERARLAIDVFGKSGASLLNVFAAGSGAMKDAQQNALDIGLALSDIDTARVVEMGRAFDDLADVSEGFGNQLTAAVAPSMTAFAQTLVAATAEGTPLRDMLDSIVVVVGSLTDNLGMFADVGSITFGAVAMGAGTLVQMLELVVGSLAAMDRGLAEIGIGEVNEDFQKLSSDIQDLADTTFQAGVRLMADGFSGKYAEAFDRAKEAVENATPATRGFGGALGEMAAMARDAEKSVGDAGRAAEKAGRQVAEVARDRQRAASDVERRVSIGAVTQGSTAAFSASQAAQDALARQQAKTAELQLVEAKQGNALLQRINRTIEQQTGIELAEVRW